MLYHRAVDMKACRHLARALVDMAFLDGAAALADEQFRPAAFLPVHARHVGVERLDLVGEAGGGEEV